MAGLRGRERRKENYRLFYLKTVNWGVRSSIYAGTPSFPRSKHLHQQHTSQTFCVRLSNVYDVCNMTQVLAECTRLKCNGDEVYLVAIDLIQSSLAI